MLFSEPLFLFAFLPAVMAAVLLLGRWRQPRLVVMLLASVFFYAWSEPLFVPVVLVSCALDLVLARAIARRERHGALLALGVAANLAILLYYKYARFAVANLAPGLPLPDIALPVGVSFIVFEKITYLVDVARRVSRPAPSVSSYLLYVFFFPKLLAGPIIKYHELDGQLRALPRPGVSDLEAGFVRFMIGLAKKVLLADVLATGADMAFRDAPGTVGFAAAWWGVLFFTLQIYFDFSGYSDMAIGIARMLGLRLRENFYLPYTAASTTDFWRRWHISLTTWIRDYLYIPLGGNRAGPGRRRANLWICFLASGLWHGAAWNFVVWGAYNGAFLVLDRIVLLRLLARLPAAVANALTMLVVMAGWAIFRATSLGQAGAMLRAMASPGQVDGRFVMFLTPDLLLASGAGVLICVLPRLPGYERLASAVSGVGRAVPLARLALLLVFVAAVGKATADPFKPFIYFRF